MLSAKERSRLSAIAQSRPCLVSLGRAGATPALAARLDTLLRDHELVKMRFGDMKETKTELAARLAEQSGSELLRIVGNVAIFWRKNPEREESLLP